MKRVLMMLAVLCPLMLVFVVECNYRQAVAAGALPGGSLQLDRQDAALRALAYDMQLCGWPQSRINATLKFYLPGGDEGMRAFWRRVETDTHRNWLGCPPKE